MSLFLLIFAFFSLARSAEDAIPAETKPEPPPALIACLTTLKNIKYYDYEGRLHDDGQLTVNKDVRDDVRKAFAYMESIKFPIKSMQPLTKYHWRLERSLAADNTSAFSYRVVKNSLVISNHAFGRALDINPFCNPDVRKSGKTDPPYAKWRPKSKCALSPENPKGKLVIDYFKNTLHWAWGGDYVSHKDRQHFEQQYDISKRAPYCENGPIK